MTTARSGSSSDSGNDEGSERISLPSIKSFPDRPSAAAFFSWQFHTSEDEARGGIKALIFEYTSSKGEVAGSIGERTSFALLVDSGVVRWSSELGMSSVVFLGIHHSTFFTVASQRVRMSADLYIDRFLPKLAEIIRTETNYTEMNSKSIIDVILLPFFLHFSRNRCKPIGHILVNFTNFNRAFFGKKFRRNSSLENYRRVKQGQKK
ncbi:unnamed protein product [Calicophoron daubneyi]|uniref:Uncharacterized protein n=1 Tax=Calicophoron daubneyi TaxID=300641 RepID=A0AAV2TRP5_CALDB